MPCSTLPLSLPELIFRPINTARDTPSAQSFVRSPLRSDNFSVFEVTFLWNHSMETLVWMELSIPHFPKAKFPPFPQGKSKEFQQAHGAPPAWMPAAENVKSLSRMFPTSAHQGFQALQKKEFWFQCTSSNNITRTYKTL